MPHIYKSSFRFTTLTAIGKDDFRKAKHIISHIIDNPESLEFREPVNWQALGLLDYPTLIANPMDLGTVLQKIAEEKYEHAEEFLDDTELIWDNCKSYNIKGSWIYQLADKLEKNCKKMLKNYFPSIPLQNVKKDVPNSQSGTTQLATLEAAHPEPIAAIPQPPKIIKSKKSQKQERQERVEKLDRLYYEDEEEITFAEKMKLADKFKVLSPAQNEEIVRYIQAICPPAFRQLDEKVQLLVDNMDIITFKQLIEKIEEIEVSGQIYSSKRMKLNFAALLTLMMGIAASIIMMLAWLSLLEGRHNNCSLLASPTQQEQETRKSLGYITLLADQNSHLNYNFKSTPQSHKLRPLFSHLPLLSPPFLRR